MLDNIAPKNKSICAVCKNYNFKKALSCKAFPDGIPEIILNGEDNHTEPLKGQTGNYVFEELKDK